MEVIRQERLIRLSEVCKITSRSRSSIYRDMQNGLFPLSLKVGMRSIAWRESDVVSWIEKLSVS